MTDEQFAAGIDAILLTGVKGHAAHRALDMWWTKYAIELGEDHPVAAATRRWMAHIEGDHDGGRYPLGRRWWQIGPFRPKLSRPAHQDEEWNLTCP